MRVDRSIEAIVLAGGRGRLDTAGNRIVRFVEKGVVGPGLINASCYVFPRGIGLEFLPIRHSHWNRTSSSKPLVDCLTGF